MPSKKKKYNARFPAGRIKKIMQTDEEVGKVAQAVPIIISRTLELFVESLLTKTMIITESRSAKTLTPSHLKQCIQSESRFDFLKDLVRNIPDASVQEDNDNNAEFADGDPNDILQAPLDLSEGSTSYGATSASTIRRTPVIQFQPKIVAATGFNDFAKVNVSVGTLIQNEEPKIHIEIGTPVESNISPSNLPDPPPLVPIANNSYGSNTGDNLYIDEDYDN